MNILNPKDRWHSFFCVFKEFRFAKLKDEFTIPSIERHKITELIRCFEQIISESRGTKS